jgi:hypothetical protein
MIHDIVLVMVCASTAVTIWLVLGVLVNVPLPAALALILVAALAGWAAGGTQTARRLAFAWTAASITHQHKSDAFND